VASERDRSTRENAEEPVIQRCLALPEGRSTARNGPRPPPARRLWPPHVNRETCTVLIDLAHAFHIPLSRERLSISRRRCLPATEPLQSAFFQWG